MNTKRSSVFLSLIVALAASAPVHAAPAEVNLLVLGDWGSDKRDQTEVALAMADYVRSTGRMAYDATLLVGDNFYGNLTRVDDPVWIRLFETMYNPKLLPMPFYAILGNHDYENNGEKARIERAYAAGQHSSRWKMPAKWYRLDLPPEHPLVTILMLDTMVKGDELNKQESWIKRELAKSSRAPWTICCGHYPLYSNGKHGDNARLLADWGPLFEKYNVDFYLAGHDHNLQHLQIPNRSTSFIISGGGGASLYSMTRADRGPFARALHGFVHLKLTLDRALVRFIQADGRWVHVFERTPDKQIHISSTTGIDEPSPRAGSADDSGPEE